MSAIGLLAQQAGHAVLQKSRRQVKLKRILAMIKDRITSEVCELSRAKIEHVARHTEEVASVAGGLYSGEHLPYDCPALRH